MRRSLVATWLVLAACTGGTRAVLPDGSAKGGAAEAGSSGGTPAGTGTSGGGVRGTTGGAASTGGTAAGGGATGGAPASDGGTGGEKADGPMGGASSADAASSGSTAMDGASGGPDTGADRGGAGAGGATSADARSFPDLAADLARDGQTSDTRPAADLAADSRATDGAVDSPTASVTVYIAGDSTVSTYTASTIHQAGWGQFLQDDFQSSAIVANKAVGGMTARHFIEAGYLDQIVATIKAGDYLLVQFGTNDGNTTATYTLDGSSTAIPYYLDPETDFKTYLTKYTDATKAKGATTIFVTPPPRHSCNSGETGVRNGLSAYATAMKELGPTLGTPVVDLNAMTMAYLANISCDTSGQTFYLVKADGSIDSTHFQENGAKIMAGLVAKGTTGISTLALPLSAYVK